MAKSPSCKISLLLLAIILSSQISFVIYKAHNCGITHDEAYTFFYFGQDINKALTSYVNPNNNHILNSFFICFSYKYFKFYEHFIRLHSILFAIAFSLSTAFIIYKTIHSNALKVIALCLVLFNWFVIDALFLARGYSIAMGSIYTGIALLLLLLSKKVKFKTLFWAPPVIIASVNFLAFGSMLSSIFVLLSINVVFTLLLSFRVYKDTPNKTAAIIANSILIPPLSIAPLYLLYRNIYQDILAARNRFGMTPFSSTIKKIFIDSFSVQNDSFVFTAYLILTLLICLGLVFVIYRQLIKIKKRQFVFHQDTNPAATFILTITIGTILAMFVHRAILKLSLGYMRNGIFLVPLSLISATIIIDKLCVTLKDYRFARPLIKTTFVITAIILIFYNLPSPHANLIHTWKQQSMSGPLVRRLKQIDPNKQWEIILTKKTIYLIWPLLYYSQFGYNYMPATPESFEVAVIHQTEKLPGLTYLDEDYFYNFDSCVLIYPPNSVPLNFWSLGVKKIVK